MNYWAKTGKDNLLKSVEVVKREQGLHAKNVIIFIGDGMSISTLTAARCENRQCYN